MLRYYIDGGLSRQMLFIDFAEFEKFNSTESKCINSTLLEFNKIVQNVTQNISVTYKGSICKHIFQTEQITICLYILPKNKNFTIFTKYNLKN